MRTSILKREGRERANLARRDSPINVAILEINARCEGLGERNAARRKPVRQFLDTSYHVQIRVALPAMGDSRGERHRDGGRVYAIIDHAQCIHVHDIQLFQRQRVLRIVNISVDEFTLTISPPACKH